MKTCRIIKNDVPCVLVHEYEQKEELEGNTHWLPATTGTVFGIALNHRELRAQMESQFHIKPHINPPKTPVLHIKTDNTHIGFGQPIPAPANGDKIYAGPALGVVIGKTAQRVSAQDAYDYIKGYTVVNEVSLAEDSFYRPAIKAKCRDGFCPIGPSIVDVQHISTPENLAINTYINGELKHSTNTNELYYGISELIEYVSSFITLQPGDLIITATPPRNVELNVGDSVVIEIEKIGRLENPVVAEQEL